MFKKFCILKINFYTHKRKKIKIITRIIANFIKHKINKLIGKKLYNNNNIHLQY